MYQIIILGFRTPPTHCSICLIVCAKIAYNDILVFLPLVLIYRFGEDLELLHGFGDAFTEEAGAKIIDGFTFDQSRTNTARTLEGVVSLLEVIKLFIPLHRRHPEGISFRDITIA